MKERETTFPADTAEHYEAPQVESILTSEDLEREGQYAGITPG